MIAETATDLAIPSSEPKGALVLRDVRKAFGETIALAGLSLRMEPGAILGIAGPNGAGKSTLVRILAGEDTRDAGDILIDGRPWVPGSGVGIAVVHQEPQLWPNLTVGQNLMVGREPTRSGFPRLPADDRSVLDEIGIGALAEQPLVDCSLAVRQRVEIARALVRDAWVFLFDEPNSALTEFESDRLFVHMHELAATNRVVVLVSHRLDELATHCERVIVIRDGRVSAELTGSRLDAESIARELVVEDADASTGTAPPGGSAAGESGQQPAPPPADLENYISIATGASGDVAIRIGEVLAVVGVEGSGGRELVATVAGHAPGQGADLATPWRPAETRRGTAFLSADRRGTLFLNLSVGDNLVARLGAPEIAGRDGILRRRRMRRLAEFLIARYAVRTQGHDQPITALSGGNQQKVAIAAALARRPGLLALEEPTRGVDIASKAEIYRILRGFARDGHAVLVYCTEVPEVFELADRVAVVDRSTVSDLFEVAAFPDIAALAAAIAVGSGGANLPASQPGAVAPSSNTGAID